MQPKKTIAGALTAVALASGGSAVAIDNQVNPYSEKASKYEVLIEGETIEISKDKPEIKLNRWGGEEGLTVKKSGDYGKAKRGWFSRQQKWQKGNESVIVEPLKRVEGGNVAEAETQGEEGFKIDILLDAKPDTNVFTLELEGWENLDFFYQAELTPEEIAEGAARPENVVGSYAVYHKTKANHRIGGTNYQTGKLYHIYRPKVLDSKGNWVWGQLGYESGVLSVTVPQEFLDGATYPVRVDPTFGYTSVGGTAVTSVPDASQYVANTTTTTGNDAPENGTIDSIHFYTPGFAAGDTVRGILFDGDNSLALVGLGAEITTANNTWNVSAMSSESLTAGTYYLPGYWVGVGTNTGYVYDTVADYTFSRAQQFGYPTPPNPANFTLENTASRKVSIYATYTADAGGGGAAPSRKTAPIMIESD